MKDIEKLVNISDDDVEIIYRRKAKSSSTDEIHGFNPIIIFLICLFGLISFVVISQNESSNSNPSNTIIVK